MSKNLSLWFGALVYEAVLMTKEILEIKVQIKGFLGSERAYKRGGSMAVSLPIELIEKYNLRSLFEKRKFLFFETNKGFLVKPIDQKVEKKLANTLKFVDISKLTDEDLKALF